MSVRALNVDLVKAVRLIRAGSASDQVCRALMLSRERVRSLESDCRDVPDEFLARLEQALAANVRLRRLIAGLGQSVLEMTRTDSD